MDHGMLDPMKIISNKRLSSYMIIPFSPVSSHEAWHAECDIEEELMKSAGDAGKYHWYKEGITAKTETKTKTENKGTYTFFNR